MSFSFRPLLPAFLTLALVACGATPTASTPTPTPSTPVPTAPTPTTPTPGAALDITGQWRGTVTLRSGFFSQEGTIDSTFYMTNAQSGDYARRPESGDNASLVVDGNTAQGTLRVTGSDVGDFHCEGTFTAQTYTSSRCVWTPPAEVPANATLSVTMLKLN